MGLQPLGSATPDLTAVEQAAADALTKAQEAKAEAAAAQVAASQAQSAVAQVETTPGPAGKSAYELACDLGYGGTLTQWVASLHGTDGQDGTDGSNGTAGTDGPNGTQGIPGPVGPLIPGAITMASLTAATAPAAASAAANVETFVAGKASRRRVDLTNATQIRLVAMVIANGNAAGAAVKVSYMTTVTAAWSGTDTGLVLVLGTGTAGTLRDSGWVNLPAGARADVTLAALVSTAFGTSAPTLGSLTAYVK